MSKSPALDLLLSGIGVESTDRTADIGAILERIRTDDMPDAIRERLVGLVRTPGYHIANLYEELSELQEIILHHGSRTGDIAAAVDAGRSISELFLKCLQETARVHERAIDNTGHGYAELDQTGTIVSFNPALARLLGTETLCGRNLLDWFPTREGTVRAALAELAEKGEGPVRRNRLPLVLEGQGEPTTVSAEFTAVLDEGPPLLCAFLSDVSAVVQAERRTFDAAEFGIVRVSRDLTFEYCNPVAAQYFGHDPDTLTGKDICDVVTLEDQETIKTQSKLRDEASATRYLLRVHPPKEESRQIEVVAFPEFDDDGRTRMSTLAFVRLVEPFQLRDQIRELIERSSSPHYIAHEASKIIQRLVPHETLVFTIFDDSGTWAWPAHVEKRPERPWSTRWFLMSDRVREWMREDVDQYNHLIIDNLRLWRDGLPEDDPLQDDPVIKDMIEGGIRSSVTVPVYNNGRLWASLSLLRTTEFECFGETESKLLNDMQIAHFVLSMRNAFDRREASKLERLKQTTLAILGHTTDDNDAEGADMLAHFSREQQTYRRVARVITRSLCRLYRWRSVSLFEVDEQFCVFRLLASFDSSEDCFLDDHLGAERGISVGLMGLAYRESEGQIVGHIDEDTPQARAFQPYFSFTNSGLAVPIKFRGRSVWMLACEDEAVNGFTVRDIEKLQAFTMNIETVLERIYNDALLTEVLNKSGEAILVTDREFRVLQANEFATRLFDLEVQELVGRPLADLFYGDADYASLASLGYGTVNNLRSVLKRRDGSRCHVLLKSSPLAASFGQRVVYATELGALDWQTDISAVGGALARIAQRTRRPVMVVRRMLTEAEGFLENEEQRQKWRQQKDEFLNAIELTYERIARFLPEEDERYKTRIDLAKFVRDVATEMDPHEPYGKWLEVRGTSAGLMTNGHEDDLRFVFRSILDYLKRQKPDRRKVVARLDQKQRDGRPIAGVTLRAVTEKPTAAPDDPYEKAYQSGSEMARLGEPAVRRIVEYEHDGSYRRRYSAKRGEQRFLIDLPLARTTFTNEAAAP